MNTIMKSIFAIWGLIAAIFMPLTAEAANSVFSGKEAYIAATLYESDSYDLGIRAFEYAAKSKSAKGSSSGAIAFGYYYDGTIGYLFVGETTDIEFEADGNIPDKVIASGSVPGTWYPLCYDVICDYDSYEDTVQFSLDAEAVTDQVVSRTGTQKSEYGAFKRSEHYDLTYAPAAFNALSITSRFGILNSDIVNYAFGEVGKSKSHSVEITKSQ